MSETIPEDLMQAAREIVADIPARFREANRPFAESVIARALMSERTRQEERVRVLEEVKTALARYDLALVRREHGDVAAGIFVDDARAALGNGGGDA